MYKRQTQWRDAIKYSVGGKNFVYAVGVDTSYPIQDDFHAENIMYEKYGSNARSIAILGVFAAIPVSYTHLDVYKRQTQVQEFKNL